MKGKPIKFSFNARTPDAERAAEKNAAKLVKQVTKETKTAIRAMIVRSIRDGIPPYEAARQIKDMIGLTSNQMQAVASYRQSLEEAGSSSEAIERAVADYTDRKIKERSVTIARTEVMEALNAGKKESWKEQIREGLLSQNAKKEGMVTDDELLCPVCEPADEQVVGIDEPFQLGEGEEEDMPPFHPRCRCTAVIREQDIVILDDEEAA